MRSEAVISKAFVPDAATAEADVEAVITGLRFIAAEITVIKVTSVQISINTISDKVSNAVIKTDTTAATNTDATIVF